MANRDRIQRKHRDIVQDVNDLLASKKYTLDFALESVAFKYYMTAEGVYQIFSKEKSSLKKEEGKKEAKQTTSNYQRNEDC